MDNAWTWNDTFATILTGIVVVFVALVLLIAVITLMGKIMSSIGAKQQAAEKNQLPAPPPPAQKVQPSAVRELERAEPVVEEGISGEVVAVISAAVAEMMAGEETNYRISSVKKVRKPARSAWARAERLENTQPF